MGVQGTFQLNLHDGGYYRTETSGWPAKLQDQAFHWLFGKSTTIFCVNIAKDMHSSTHTLRFHRRQNWHRERQSDDSACSEE